MTPCCGRGRRAVRERLPQSGARLRADRITANYFDSSSKVANLVVARALNGDVADIGPGVGVCSAGEPAGCAGGRDTSEKSPFSRHAPARKYAPFGSTQRLNPIRQLRAVRTGIRCSAPRLDYRAVITNLRERMRAAKLVFGIVALSLSAFRSFSTRTTSADPCRGRAIALLGGASRRAPSKIPLLTAVGITEAERRRCRSIRAMHGRTLASRRVPVARPRQFAEYNRNRRRPG